MHMSKHVTFSDNMEITKSLQRIVSGTRGIQHIIVTDKDGVPVIGINESGGETVCEYIYDSLLESVLIIARVLDVI